MINIRDKEVAVLALRVSELERVVDKLLRERKTK